MQGKQTPQSPEIYWTTAICSKIKPKKKQEKRNQNSLFIRQDKSVPVVANLSFKQHNRILHGMQ